MSRPSFAKTVLILTVVFLLVVVSRAQSESTVYEGRAFGTIKVGESTESDVIAAHGVEYKLIKHGSYSFEMLYKDLGLEFYYCAADPRKEIFAIEFETPTHVATSKGVRLGLSTMDDVFKAYGKPSITSAGYEYEGIYFDTKGDDTDESEDDARAPKAENTEQNAAPKPEDKQSAPAFQIDLAGIDVTASTTVKNKRRKEDEEDYKAKQMKAVAGEVVRRIVLIEPELRQCETKFRVNR